MRHGPSKEKIKKLTELKIITIVDNGTKNNADNIEIIEYNLLGPPTSTAKCRNVES